MKLWRRIKRNFRCFGWSGVTLALRETLTTRPVAIRVRSGHLGRAVWVRLNTTDISIYHQIFVDREYQLPLSRAPRVIVDAGANTGFSALYFAQKYPEARIIAIEPEPSNLAVLRRNVDHSSQIEILDQALWHESTELDLFDPGAGRAGLQKDGFQTLAPGTAAGRSTVKVRAIDLDTIMRQRSIGFIDLLKVDIEGAERELFAHSGRWIRNVGTIVVELHDRMRQGCSRAFYLATAHFPVATARGEHVVVSQAGLIEESAISRR